MDVQASYRARTEAWAQSHLQPIQRFAGRDIPAALQLQGRRDNRRALDADHAHAPVGMPPKASVSSFMGYLKGKSAPMMRALHANLKHEFGSRRFRSEGCRVSTVGLSEATIAKHVREQEARGIALGKLSVKEHEDPFGKKQGRGAPLGAAGQCGRRFKRQATSRRQWAFISRTTSAFGERYVPKISRSSYLFTSLRLASLISLRTVTFM